MFGFYPRPQPTYYQSPYSYAAQQQRARAYEIQRQRELERQRLLQTQEMERRRRAAAAARYFPDGYDEHDYDEEYLHPQQRAILEARRRHEALEQRRFEAARQAHAMRQRAREPSSRRSLSPVAEPVTALAQPHIPSAEELEAAATKIQTAYRVHRALRQISSIAANFDSLTSSFTTPTSIDYQSDGRTGSVPVPTTLPEPSDVPSSAKLAYTPTNVPLHTYAELLSRLLVSLDAIESHGDHRVREARKAAVRAVEAEAARIESLWQRVWDAHVQIRRKADEQQGQEEEDEVSAMVFDAPASVPELTADVGSESDSDEFATPVSTPISGPTILPHAGESVEEDGVLVDREREEEDKEFVFVDAQ